MGSKDNLEAGLVPERVWRLGWSQRQSGGWVGPRQSGGWVGPRDSLEAGWVPDTGGWVSPRDSLEAGLVPETVWRLRWSQRQSGGSVGPRDSLEAGWVPESVWGVNGSQEPKCRFSKSE